MKPSQQFMPLPLWLYGLAWIFFVYLFISLLQFKAEDPGNIILAGMYLINFGIHEISHLVMMFFPPIFVAAAGSIGEIGFTLLLLYAALKQKAYFAACFATLWVMLGFISVGRYMADARTQLLPLIGPGETVKHDWHFVFSELGWLEYDTLLGGAVQGVGALVGVAGLITALYLMILTINQRKISA